MLTDRYELTMLDAALFSGAASQRAVFEVFARGLPPGRRFGVVAGTGRLVEAIADFRFGDEELAYLQAERVVSPRTLEVLAAFRFSGHLDAYPEGECYFPNSPVCTVEASFGEAVLLETLVLSILNFDTAVASAAARMVLAGAGRPLVEMGSRRVHEQAAVSAARAAYVAGFASTSNLEAGRRYGLPTAGTAAHAFTLAHGSEEEAFGAQLDSLGLATTLLVDTYDVPAGIEAAVAAARARGAKGPGAIRLDSGDLATLALQARAHLDRLGASETGIVVSSDLDEAALEVLASAPIDVYGVGTRVATGSGAPTAGFVYKLVAIGEGERRRPVAKRSEHKGSIGGRKRAYRLFDEQGIARSEVLRVEGADDETWPVVPKGWDVRPLQVRLLESGVPTPAAAEDLETARQRVRSALSALTPAARLVQAGVPALEARIEERGTSSSHHDEPGKERPAGA